LYILRCSFSIKDISLFNCELNSIFEGIEEIIFSISPIFPEWFDISDFIFSESMMDVVGYNLASFLKTI
jgi:hypothetical protein